MGAIKPEYRYNLIILLLGLCFLIAACNKDKQGTIPNVAVNIYIYPASDPQFTDLNAVGGWVYVVGGSRGILIFRKSIDEFMAYDRHCPYQPADDCGRIEVDSTNINATDPCCGSGFQLFDGSIMQGPASRPLKQYATDFDGTVLHVFN